MGHEYKASQDPKLAERILNPRVVDKEMKESRAKLRDSFGIDAIPSVKHTMQQLNGDAFPMEEKETLSLPYEYERKGKLDSSVDECSQG